jgi:hypothetical protein
MFGASADAHGAAQHHVAIANIVAIRKRCVFRQSAIDNGSDS